MPIALANTALVVASAYLLVGAVFAVCFVVRGAAIIDHGAASGGWGFRLLIMPGAALLWPWLARAWARGDTGPPALARARSLRRRHVPMWLVVGPLSLIGLGMALLSRGVGIGGAP